MAISIRGGAPSVGTNNGSSATVSVTTPTGANEAQVGDVVLVIHGNDFYNLSNMPTPTATGSPTMNAIAAAVADAGANNGHAKAYWYEANTAGAQTVQVTETGSADEEKCIVAYVLDGVDTADPIDDAASNFSSSGANPQIAPAVSPDSSDALLITHINSGGGGSTTGYATPGGMDEEYEIHVGGLSGVGASQQLAASGSTGTRSFTPDGDTPYVALTFALRTASGGATVEIDGARAVTADRTGAAAVDRAVDGARAVTATVAGAAAADRPIDGARAVTATVAGGATVDRAVDGVQAVAVARVGAATIDRAVDGVRAVSVALSGDADVIPAGQVSADGARAVSVALAGAASVERTVDGALAVTVSLAGVGAVESGSAPSTPVGGWQTMINIMREARHIAIEERVRPPSACPRDGEPLRHGPAGELYCPYDGWQYQFGEKE